MTDISSECEASGYACFHAEMLPIVLLSASQEDSLEPGTKKTIWRGPCREEREGAQCHLCYIYLLFQSLKQIKGSIKYHTPLASSGAWREECLEWELAILMSPPTLEKLSGWRSLSRITPYRLSGCTKRNEMAQVQKWILQEDCKAPATVSPTSTVPGVVYQGPQDVACQARFVTFAKVSCFNWNCVRPSFHVTFGSLHPAFMTCPANRKVRWGYI